MIYATHKLYDYKQRVATFQVVETKEGCVSSIYDFKCEKHSMRWCDAIVLSSNNKKNSLFRTLDEVLEYLKCKDDGEPVYAYGVTFDGDECSLARLF